MDANTQTIRQVFSMGGYIQYVLPHFQREYTWEQADWKTLWEDAETIYHLLVQRGNGHDGRTPEHFLGSLVRIAGGVHHGITAFTLVDGQQRLTTVSLMLCALCDVARTTHPDVTESATPMLINPGQKGEMRYKVLPTTKHGDRAAYTAIVDAVTRSQSVEAASTESRIAEAFAYLRDLLAERIAVDEIDPELWFTTLLGCLAVVTIDLSRDEQPYKIFESLNAKGKPLTPGDLVRNYVAMTLPPSLQDEVFEKQWAVIEDRLQERRVVGNSGIGELTGFLRHYLAAYTENLYRIDQIYPRFRDRIREDFPASEDFITEIARLRRHAEWYDRLLRPEREPDGEIRSRLLQLQIFEMSTAFPFLLRAYAALDAEEITRAEFIDLLEMLENYAVRRFLCGKQANYLNNMFPTLWAQIDTDAFVASARVLLATKQYPSDSEVRNAAQYRNVYAGNRDRTVRVLEEINRWLSRDSDGHGVLSGKATLEHILPQSRSTAWVAALGENAANVYREQLHTIGNLTLVTQGWNSALSDNSFAEKCSLLAKHALALNTAYFGGEIEQWDSGAITARAQWLADAVLAVWPSFDMSPPDAPKSGMRPIAVSILGTPYPVKTWRDVMFQTVVVIAELLGDDGFAAFAQHYPGYLAREPFPYRPRKLANGWWLYLNLSRIDVLKSARGMLATAKIPLDEWKVEEVTT